MRLIPQSTVGKTLLRWALITGAAACAGCESTGPVPEPAKNPNPYSRANDVRIDNFTFAPARLTIPTGTTVTWTNRDDVPHTVVADARQFKSPALDTDDRFSHTFTKSGTFPYFCGVHPHMTGTIIVR
jgi:plastocyanin